MLIIRAAKKMDDSRIEEIVCSIVLSNLLGMVYGVRRLTFE